MEYRAVGNCCAVDLEAMRLPVSCEEALKILKQKGFKVLDVDMIALARECIGRSEYRRGARPSEASAILDCSSFVKWLYGQRGIWLPRRTIQQVTLGRLLEWNEDFCEATRPGDLVFVSGWINWYLHDPESGIEQYNVGHVGILTGESTVIHAANRKAGVIETPLAQFIGGGKFRGVRRYVPCSREILTLEIPPQREVETSDDIKWIILQSLPPRQ